MYHIDTTNSVKFIVNGHNSIRLIIIIHNRCGYLVILHITIINLCVGYLLKNNYNNEEFMINYNGKINWLYCYIKCIY